MSTKSVKAKPRKAGFRNAPDDLVPRDAAAEEVFMESFMKRNKEALNASIEKARAQVARGKYFTRDQVMADVKAQRQRRRTEKK